MHLLPFTLLLSFQVATIEPPPHPRERLGFAPGEAEELLRYEQSAQYFKELDRLSDRIHVETIGRTSEGRELLLALIGSPERLAAFDRSSADLARISDPRGLEPAEEKRILAEAPAVVFLSMSMHATEVGAAQYAPTLAWELVTREDEAAVRVRRELVVALLPSTNADGMSMVADWYYRRREAGKPEAPLPFLYQRYAGHDNNRDWFMLNLAETRAITHQLYHRLHPVVLLDMHQMGSAGPRYFVPPYSDPVNPNLDPILTQALNLLGTRMAHDMTAAGCKGVCTNTKFDNWWVGGNRNVPFRHNVLGILTECASANLADPVRIEPSKLQGLGVNLPLHRAQENHPDPWEGGTWTLADITRYNRAAAWSLLAEVARNRREYLARKLELGRRAVALGETEAPFGYLLQDNGPRARRLVATLQALGVEVRRLDEDLAAAAGRPAFARDSFWVPFAQPYRAMAKDMCETQHYPELLDAPKGKVIQPYDQAGWTLPEMFRVPSWPVHAVTTLRSRAAEAIPLPPTPTRRDPRPGGAPGSRPKLALFESYAPSMDEGWTRYVLDLGDRPYVRLDHNRIRAGGLHPRYQVLAFPSLTPKRLQDGVDPDKQLPEYAGGLGVEGGRALVDFVQKGGRIVAWGQSVDYFLRLFEIAATNLVAGDGGKGFSCPGSLLRVEVTDEGKTSELLRGYEADFAVYHKDPVSLEGEELEVLLRYADEPFVSGYLAGKEKIAGKAALARVSRGRGELLLFAFRPQNRGQTLGTFDLLLNALETE